MIKLFSHRDRAVHLGAFPLERLARATTTAAAPRLPATGPLPGDNPSRPHSLRHALRDYLELMDRLRSGAPAPTRAPIPDEPAVRADHLQAACYYLDASMAATCRIPAHAWSATPRVNTALRDVQERQYGAGAADNVMAEIAVREGREAWRQPEATFVPGTHDYALVILHEYPRDPDTAEPGGAWIQGMQIERAALRGAEVGAVMANYLRMLGYEARLHTITTGELELDAMGIAAGLTAPSAEAGRRPGNPFVGERYGIVVVSTTLELADAAPLSSPRAGRDFRWWLGVGGTRPGYAGAPFARRPYHLGPYPMEKVRGVDNPTTRIDVADVPRVPKRHDMFIRAAMGDLGDKAQKELQNFRMITKSPFGHAMIPVLGGMVPLQYGTTAETVTPGYEDPKRNAEFVKAALYYLGADMVGICEIPRYAWYSHNTDGSPIEPYHRYAIVILIDQGYETMEGASGDDWISGAQSMRAYLRAQLVGGVLGAQLRRLGYSARGHSVMDQDVLHIPLILQAGLGELSRIGELVLNPFVGPRFKSGIVTTDLPLMPDRPIDFGLQDFCAKCTKCARECPCAAIPFGDKILFNSYEMWKPDVEKCARYRITNAAGSMCGRCMKTCPWNVEGVLSEAPFRWAAMHLPFARRSIARLDDKVGNGRINPRKKWWWDLDTDQDGRIIPARKTNERQLVFRPPLGAEEQKLACYPPDLAPGADAASPTPPDRRAGMERYATARASTRPRS
ncbi:MAG: reductive dehalogenase domain-containing protein [Gammaproteobacteria bacterium]